MGKKSEDLKILAVETSGRACGAALAAGAEPKVIGEVSFDIGLRHSDILKSCCSFLMDTAGWKPGDLTHLAVSVGPGSFTGIRVGLSFTRALAQTLKIPLIGISTFEILASQARAGGVDGPLCVCFESIGADVFTGFFRPGSLKPKTPYAVLSQERLTAELKKASGIAGLGDGYDKHRGTLKSAIGKNLRDLPPEFSRPGAAALARLAAQRLRSGRRPPSWDNVTPLYMRPPLAVERLKNLVKGKKS